MFRDRFEVTWRAGVLLVLSMTFILVLVSASCDKEEESADTGSDVPSDVSDSGDDADMEDLDTMEHDSTDSETVEPDGDEVEPDLAEVDAGPIPCEGRCECAMGDTCDFECGDGCEQIEPRRHLQRGLYRGGLRARLRSWQRMRLHV